MISAHSRSFTARWLPPQFLCLSPSLWDRRRHFSRRTGPARISDTLQFFIDLLAAVPSVIYGLLGVFIVDAADARIHLPAAEQHAWISSDFSGPVLRRWIPDRWVGPCDHGHPVHHFRLARSAAFGPARSAGSGFALGSTRWESTWKVVVPFAKTGIMGSIFSRWPRLGETMAVTMVIGNTPKIAASLFSPGYSIAAVIANEFTEATGTFTSSH